MYSSASPTIYQQNSTAWDVPEAPAKSLWEPCTRGGVAHNLHHRWLEYPATPQDAIPQGEFFMRQLKRAPKGWRWIFTTKFWHWRAKRFLYAADYGRVAWCFLAIFAQRLEKVKLADFTLADHRHLLQSWSGARSLRLDNAPPGLQCRPAMRLS